MLVCLKYISSHNALMIFINMPNALSCVGIRCLLFKDMDGSLAFGGLHEKHVFHTGTRT